VRRITTLVVLLGLVLLIPIQNVLADTTTYEILPDKLREEPTICAVEPSDSMLTKEKVKEYMKVTKDAIKEWETKLKLGSSKKSSWDVHFFEITINEVPSFDFTNCDVIIKFARLPPSQQAYLEVLGWEYVLGGISYIDIFFQEIGTCETQDAYYIYLGQCYANSVITPRQVGAIMRHEFGHTLGLGHYTSGNQQDTYTWATNFADAPSIMVPIIHIADEYAQIKIIDTQMVKEIYSSQGFGEASPKITKEVAKELVTFQLNDFSVSKQKIVPTSYQSEIQKISGVLPDWIFKRGQPIEFKITYPDGTYQNLRVPVTNKGVFQYMMTIDSTFIKGTYTIQGTYLGYTTQSISFDITDNISSKTIPKSDKPLSETKDKFQTDAKKLQSDLAFKIDSLSKGIQKSEQSITGKNYDTTKAQEELTKAQNSLKEAKKYLNSAKSTQKEGNQFILDKKFEDAFYKYKYSLSQTKKIEDKLFEITKHLRNAQSYVK
jgi:hypothetical protein